MISTFQTGRIDEGFEDVDRLCLMEKRSTGIEYNFVSTLPYQSSFNILISKMFFWRVKFPDFFSNF